MLPRVARVFPILCHKHRLHLVQDLHQSIADRKKTTEWCNIIVSFLHAVFCSVSITYCVWMHGPEMAADLMHADVTAARLLLCMSAGYFLADSYDLWRANVLTWDLAVHHVVVSDSANESVRAACSS